MRAALIGLIVLTVAAWAATVRDVIALSRLAERREEEA